MKFIILSISLIFSMACSTATKVGHFEKPSMTDSDYTELIEKFTRKAEKYDGFQNLYNIQATFLNTEVYSALIDRQRFNKQLSTSESQKLREKAFRHMSTETHFFVSYYSPEKSLRHLDRGDALWKIYLERDGRRFEAKISRYPGVKFNTQDLFSFHSRWSQGYLLRFNVPTSAVESSDAKLIFSSSAGQVEFDYSPNEK